MLVDSSQFTLLRVAEARPQVAQVTLDRPDRLNALSWPLVDELHAVLDAIGADNSLRAVVLTGAGRGFCAGLDLAEGGGSSRSDGNVVDAALDVADEILGYSPFGVVMTKQVIWANLQAASAETAIDLENRTQILASQSGDFVEAVTAFMEKRPPVFRRPG